MSPTLIHYQMHHSGLLPLLNCKLSLQNSGKTGSYQTISLINYSVIIYMHKNIRTVNPYNHGEKTLSTRA